jgi:hypothetical protein
MKYNIVLTALTPIAHGDTLTGIDNSTNVRLFMRQNVIVNGVPVRVPSISENSMRSTFFRRPLADHLIATAGAKELPKTVVNLLYSGGNLMSGAKSPSTEFALGKALRAMYPSLELVSGAVDNFVLPPGALRLCAWPVASEYANVLRHVAPPEIVGEARNVSAFELVSEEVRTRGTGAESEGNQMLYSYEVMAAGAKIFIQIDVDDSASELCHSAAGFALSKWDGFIGGQGRQGRGRMAIEHAEMPMGGAYANYVADNADALREGLESGKFGTAVVLCGGK